ncbi:phage tail tape measure protein [Pseudomonas sp. FSL R10-0399]|uniref:phage tail tape measure protein n=1 Tax=Pseudomonas sp. FSL R10-0399 TaxID=2662194 RepID=UPI001297ECAF|nr:phage tail tape measure protein [Pseudomonas sp. FSL R10-0399]MQT56909.1 phage tail tape measure protein [Pseudomonas sp. FSL R10-0399]
MADRSARLAFILSLTDKITAPLGRVKTSFSDLAEQGQNNIKTMGLGLAGMVGAGVAISQSLEPALEMNRALGEVRSLGVAEDALDALNRKSLEFSVAYGENARDFVASAYSIEGAIKGLSGSQLATFTNTSNLLAKATKTDADTMGAYVGTMYNLFKDQADAMGKSQWVEKMGGQTALAVQLFRTDGAQLKDAFKEVGAIATTAGVDLAEQFAVIGTLSSTMEGGDAGGMYKALFENIGAGSEKLGMKFTDQNGKLLPMLDILDKLQGKLGDLTTAAAGTKLTEAFGGEGARVIGALAKDTGRLRNGMEQLGNVRGLESADKMARAMVDPWQQFGAAVQALRIAFGQALLPILAPLMAKLTGVAQTLTRWSQLFPNITRVVSITALTVLGITAVMSALTLVVGISKMVWLGLVTVWKILTWTGFRSIAMFLMHGVIATTFVLSMMAMVAWMGLVRGAMLLWQGAIWLVNAALLANPIVWIVVGVVALIAAVAAAVYYWDEWTSALLNSEAFQWVSDQLQGLSDWFSSMDGWSGMAKAAWDGIINIFKNAINGLIEMLNKIPGVQIDAAFGELPAAPKVPDLAMQKMQAQPAPPLVMAQQPPAAPSMLKQMQTPLNRVQQPAPLVMAASQPALPGPRAIPAAPTRVPPSLPAIQIPTPKMPQIDVPSISAPKIPQIEVLQPPRQAPALVMAAPPQAKSEQSQERLNSSLGSLSPSRPNAVPKGGLLSSIQNNNQTQNKGTHVENLNITNTKPMNPLELENMMSMAVGG